MGIADKDYFLNLEGNIAADELEAHQLLIRKGQEIPKEMADKYGIGKVTPSEEAADDSTVDEKSEQPAKNKAKSPAKNKAA